MKKNSSGLLSVTVTDPDGSTVGMTYPKRAKNLVKKCRAVYVSDNEIRLNSCPTYDKNTEELQMDSINNAVNAVQADNANYIFFDPRKWQTHRNAKDTTVFNRFFIDDPITADGMKQVVSIGTWQHNWCEITQGLLRLERNTKYHFVFWLNGGENDRGGDEVCELNIMFTDSTIETASDEWNNRLTFRLNRSYIKPLKHFAGWELYDISFVTEDKEYTDMRFMSMNAPMALMHADAPEAYADLPDSPDEFADKRPQRHNIVFENGWPARCWYSTETLRSGGRGNDSMEEWKNQSLQNQIEDMDLSGLIDTEEIMQRIMDEIDVDSIVDDIKDELGEEFADNINIDQLKQQIISSITGSITEG